jgi:MFS transporter, OFA family, oxalate/formate antiporter
MSNLSEGSRSYHGWVVVAVAFLAQFVAFGLVFSFGVFYEPLVSDLHWARGATVGAFSAYAITHNVFAPVAGKICDRFGPRLVVTMGGFCLGLAMLLMGRITVIWQLYLVYAVIFALGVGSIYAPLMATVSQWFTEKRGIAVGIVAAGIGAGPLVFSPLSAWLISYNDWRTAYTVLGVVCLILFVPVVKFIKPAPKRNIGVETGRGVTQDYTADQVWKTRTLWMIGLAWLFAAIALWAVMINIVPLLIDGGVSLVTAGIVAGVIGGGSILGRIGGGFLSDRIGRKHCFLYGMIAQLMGVILLLFCQEPWMFFIFAAIFGLGMGGWGGVVPSLPADFFGSKAAATILGFIVVFAGIGVAIGPLAGACIFDVTGSYHNVIWMCIIASGIATIFAFLIKAPAMIKQE